MSSLIDAGVLYIGNYEHNEMNPHSLMMSILVYKQSYLMERRIAIWLLLLDFWRRSRMNGNLVIAEVRYCKRLEIPSTDEPYIFFLY